MATSTVETPNALPQLTRIVPLEVTAVRKARTKRVDGANLPSRCFAYVGDLTRVASWLLAIRFLGDAEKTKLLIRDAIAKFDQTEMPDAKQKARAWRRLMAAATKHGIDVRSAEAEQKYVPSAEVAAFRAAAVAEDDADDPDYDEEEEEQRDSDVFEMSFSSETPVPRWFGEEILDHSSACVDMTRAGNGLAYLVDHDTGDQVGIIENMRVEGKKLRGDVRFSRSQRGQDIKRDVQDGIRPFTSVGYRVMEMVLEKEQKDDNGTQRTYRVTKWMPMEGSTVAVPADQSVGAGRAAAGQQEFPISVRSAVASESAPPAQSTRVEVRTMDPKHVQEIIQLCNTHAIDSKRQQEIFAMKDLTVEMASREILADVAKRGGRPVTTPSAESTMLELNEREQKQYNLCRGIMTLVHNEENKSARKTSFETEISQELEKRTEPTYKKRGGLFVPFKLSIDPEKARLASEMLQRAATTLTAQTATKGLESVFTEPGSFIEFLYNRMRLKELGAETMSGLQGNIAFPKQTGKASGSWVAENPGADVADSNLTLSQVLMSPKTYQSSASYSRQLLAQAVIDIDNLVRRDLASDAALALDLAGISGTGAANDPKGILSTTGVQNYVLEADTGNAGKPNWDDITFMEELLEEVNADQLGEFGWLTTPGIKGLFKRTPRLLYAPAGGTTVNVTGDPIWTDDNEIDGYMARASNQVPNTLTKGTAAGICHALIVGVFSSLINGLWGSGFELVVDPYRLKKQGLIELTTFILTDWANRYPSGFVAAKDCLRS